MIDIISRPEPLTEKEQSFADWCAEHGLIAVFGKCFPDEDGEYFTPFFTYEMGIEDFVNNKVVAHFHTTYMGGGPPQWELQERMLRESFERTKAEA